MENTRFDFEQQLLDCWSVINDINTLADAIYDNPTPLTDDEISNVLIGISHLYDLKFRKLFKMFEDRIDIQGQHDNTNDSPTT